MDSFDDLLAPSRQVLEDNPFADPFSRRSASPDPWSSFTQPTSSVFNSESVDAEPLHSEPMSSSKDDESANETTNPNAPSDPLDSVTQLEDDDDEDNKPLGTLRSPGFRESVSTFSETATIRPTELEDHAPTTAVKLPTDGSSTPSKETSSPVQPTKSVTPPPSRSQHSSKPSAGFITHHSPSASQSNFVPPLGQSQSGVGPIERSVAALSLGGEALGGWHSENNDWGGDPSSPVSTATPTTAIAPVQGQVEDDSDDDKPIGQTLKLGDHSITSTPTKPTRKDDGLQPVFVITVDDPQKVGDPIRSFTMYTVHTRTTSPLYQKSAFSVLRRYSDFLWLYETLSLNNPGVVVPPVPEKNSFGRFDDQFVKQRRLGLEKCIQKTANHPILGKDPDLKLFLESDTFALDIKHRKAEIAHERGGVLASIGQTIVGPRFYETDEWFDRQKGYLDSLESQLRGLVKSIELVAKHRADMGVAAGEFAQTVADLSSSDVGKQLSQSLAGLAEVERKSQSIQQTQSEQDMVTFMATADEYARLINSVRLAFNSRIRTYHAWKASEGDLLRAKQTHEKNRAQNKIPNDRLGHSLAHIAEAERKALEAKHEYDHVSKLVKTEVARFEQERIEDFKDSLHAFLEGLISRQKELIASWENYQQMLLKRVGGGGPAAVRNGPGTSASSSLAS